MAPAYTDYDSLVLQGFEFCKPLGSHIISWRLQSNFYYYFNIKPFSNVIGILCKFSILRKIQYYL